MLKDTVVKYYYKPNGYNMSCAEAMLKACDEYFGLKLPEKMYYAASGFSGGAWHNEMCGCVASSIAVLSILYSVEGHAHDSPLLKRLVPHFLMRFEQQFTSTRCGYLKKQYHQPDIKCQIVLEGCADILEEIISTNEIINKQ